MKILRKHLITGEEHVREIDVTHAQMDAWRAGVLAQRAFPHITPDEREFIISGITDFDERFKDE